MWMNRVALLLVFFAAGLSAANNVDPSTLDRKF